MPQAASSETWAWAISCEYHPAPSSEKARKQRRAVQQRGICAPARHELARRWHEQIFKAIADHDAAEAEGAMFQHLDIMEKDLLNRLQPADGDAHNQKLYSHPLLTSFESEQPDSSEIIRSTR